MSPFIAVLKCLPVSPLLSRYLLPAALQPSPAPPPCWCCLLLLFLLTVICLTTCWRWWCLYSSFVFLTGYWQVSTSFYLGNPPHRGTICHFRDEGWSKILRSIILEAMFMCWKARLEAWGRKLSVTSEINNIMCLCCVTGILIKAS